MNHPDYDPREGMALAAFCFAGLIILAAIAAFVAFWR